MLQEGIKPDSDKIASIMKMKPSMDLAGLQRFLGLTSYYHKFILDYSMITEPFNVLLKSLAFINEMFSVKRLLKP